MKHLLFGLALAALFALPAEAACYADYKAKRDGPLRLHYGVVAVSDGACADAGKARKEVQSKLKRDGWKLLTVLSTFDDSGLDARRSDAGQYFLRY